MRSFFIYQDHQMRYNRQNGWSIFHYKFIFLHNRIEEEMSSGGDQLTYILRRNKYTHFWQIVKSEIWRGNKGVQNFR